jgi:TetR/AcrR family transcriptional regulator, transcriptional repressor for nem operon
MRQIGEPQDTKREILRIGAEIFGHSGFNATGLDAVLKRAKVPKGSFYYYFPSKQKFGLAVIDQCAQQYSDRLQTFLKDRTYSPLTRLRNYLESRAAGIGRNECKRGCLIGNLGQELASQNETFRKRLNEVFDGWVEQFAACLEEAKAKGELSRAADSERLAQFLLNGWEGAILRSKVMKSASPMQTFIALLFERVLK